MLFQIIHVLGSQSSPQDGHTSIGVTAEVFTIMLLNLCILRITKLVGSAACPQLSGLSGTCSAEPLCLISILSVLTVSTLSPMLSCMHEIEPCHNAGSNMLHVELLSCQALISVRALLPGKLLHHEGLSLFASDRSSPSLSRSAGAGHSLHPPQMCTRHLIDDTALPHKDLMQF